MTQAEPLRAGEVLRLLFETAIHTVFLPGTIVYFLPRALFPRVYANGIAAGDLGFVPIALGTALLGWCTWDFISSGRGTPNPIDPPQFLVARGPYRWVRNPMYLAVGTIVLGEAMLFGSFRLVLYTAFVMAVFHLFVITYEEPFLRGRFCGDYADYCRIVNRWIPRRPHERRP
jgi:protein-S-isoprenylcysteine O-methyltransferase Ste14